MSYENAVPYRPETSQSGLAGYTQMQAATLTQPKIQRLSVLSDELSKTLERMTGVLGKLRSIRGRFEGERPEKDMGAQARPCRSGHIGRLEDQVQGCFELVGEIDAVVNDLGAY